MPQDTSYIASQKEKSLQQFELVEVKTKQETRQFLKVHVELNKDDPNWIQPLDQDVDAVFNKKANKFYQQGEAIRWLLVDSSGHRVGRVAAFVNKRYTNKGDDVPVGGFGFFDCINNQTAANMLLEVAKSWLANHGTEAIDGPINFGERNKWWGLLVDGFEAPLYGMNYNPPYYQHLLETYGFKIFYNQVCFYIDFSESGDQLNKKFYSAHAKFVNNPDYRVANITKKELKGYASDFAMVYNQAWAGHTGNKTLTEAKAYKMFLKMKPIMDDYLGWIAYYKDEPVSVYINIPDLNQIVQHLNGKMNWWSKLKFLYYLKKGQCTRFVGVVYGIIPEFQGTGVDYFMIVEAERGIKANTNYTSTELQWIGEFNPKMLAIARHLDGVENRRLAVFRYLFDRNKVFQPHPVLG